MRNIIVLLVITALFSFGLVSASGGFSQFWVPAAADTDCDALYDNCIGEGDSCTGDFLPASPFCNLTDSENSTCCASGLKCLNVSGDATCVADNVDEDCDSDSDCYSNFLILPSTSQFTHYQVKCLGDSGDKTCVVVYGPGDSCSVDSDCNTNSCSNDTSTCVGYDVGHSCTAGQCAYGSLCATNGDGNKVCVAQSDVNGACTSDFQCALGLACNGTCIEAFSLPANSSCQYSNNVCDTDLVCFNDVCVEGTEWEQEDCDTNADCESGEECICSQISGEQFCSPKGEVDFSNFTNTREARADLYECVRENNCTNLGLGPNSCVEQNCGSDADDTESLNCDVGDDLLGSCYVNDSCGGFPLWAIIVIIVVAVVLVLVVVVVVVMAMRRKRQYDTIA